MQATRTHSTVRGSIPEGDVLQEKLMWCNTKFVVP